MKIAEQLSKSGFIFRLVVGIFGGGLLLPVVTGLSASGYLRWSQHIPGWLDFFVSLFWGQLTLTGALLGVLSVILWWGRRGMVARGACCLCSVVVLYLTYEWFIGLWVLDSHIRPTRGLFVIIATPVSLWALLLLFFSLVARERR